MTFSLHINRQQYGGQTLLHDIKEDYAEGMIHGFLGENGAEKTTLFLCMAGQLKFEGEPTFPRKVRVGWLPA